MASTLLSSTSKAQRCSSCMRSINSAFPELFFAPMRRLFVPRRSNSTQGQGSSAKKLAIRLLQDIPGYGEKGSIIRVSSATMRFRLYRYDAAEYVTRPELKDLGLAFRDVPTRYKNFKPPPPPEPEKEEYREPEPEPEEEEEAEISNLVFIELLKQLLPPTFPFYRKRNIQAIPPPAPTTNPNLSPLAQTSLQIVPTADHVSDIFFGSVSTSDVAAAIREILHRDAKPQKQQVFAENIVFVEKEGIERGRVKKFGTFEFDIQFDGTSEKARRTIEVKPKE